MNNNEYTLIGERITEALRAKIEGIFGELGSTVTVEHVLRIKKEAGKIAAKQKINDANIPQGFTNGCRIITTLNNMEYIRIINDNAICNDGTAGAVWVYQPPTEPATYDPAALTVTNAAQRAQMEAAHEQRKLNYYLYATVEEGIKQAITENPDLEALIISLDNDEVGYANSTVRVILNKLITKAKKAQGTVKRAELRESLKAQWDGASFDKLIKRQEDRRTMILVLASVLVST